MEILAVSAVASHIGQVLGSDPLLQDVWIRGEIASLSRSQAGHFYFALRDESSQLKCVLFRGAAARAGIFPQNGAAVILHGRVDFYETGGICEVCVDLLYPEGTGLAQLQLEALSLRLEMEGLFAPERKRAMPQYPRRIGLVTSDGGAVLHDVLRILERRWPLVEVVLAPSSVQGERAPLEICAALERLARYHRDVGSLDIVVVARGGGAEQELAVFNDERVARAFFGCPVPIVSAIGHETDVTIADFVADLRAPTPSAAAEMITPDLETLREMVRGLADRAREATSWRIRAERGDLEAAEIRLMSHSPAAEVARQRAEVTAALRSALALVQQSVRLARVQVSGRELQLEALSPRRTLERGYAVCTVGEGEVVRSVNQVSLGDVLTIQVVDGALVGPAIERRPLPAEDRAGHPTEGQHGASVANF